MTLRRDEEVTYAFCGIPDPAAFYADKQQGSAMPSVAALIADPFGARNVLWSKHLWIARAVASLARRRGRRLRILDYGCGYGPLGILTDVVDCELYGVDYNDAAAGRLAEAGYAGFVSGDFLTADVARHGPFDVICSLDVYGHVEFRHKDAMLARWHDLLAPGGMLVDGVEVWPYDYHGDPAERAAFAEVDGHVGLEGFDDVLARYRRRFAHVAGQCRYGLTINADEIVKFARSYRQPAYAAWAELASTFTPAERDVFDVAQGFVFWSLTERWRREWDTSIGFGFVVASDEPLDVGAVPGPWPAAFGSVQLVDYRASLPLELRGAVDLALAYVAERADATGVRVPVANATHLSPPRRRWVQATMDARRMNPTTPLVPQPPLARRLWGRVPEGVRASAPVVALRRSAQRRGTGTAGGGDAA